MIPPTRNRCVARQLPNSDIRFLNVSEEKSITHARRRVFAAGSCDLYEKEQIAAGSCDLYEMVNHQFKLMASGEKAPRCECNDVMHNRMSGQPYTYNPEFSQQMGGVSGAVMISGCD